MFKLVSPPAMEPIALSDVKAALRVEHDTDDAVISQMLTTARTFIERRLDWALLEQTWSLTLSELPSGTVALRPGPVASVVNVEVQYGTNAPITLTDDQYRIRFDRETLICFAVAGSDGGDDLANLVVTFTSGIADSADLSADLVRAVYLLTAHYYEERELFRRDRYVPVPLSVEALLEAHREVRL